MILLTNMTVQRGLTTEHSKYLISLNSHLAMEPKITILNKILKHQFSQNDLCKKCRTKLRVAV